MTDKIVHKNSDNNISFLINNIYFNRLRSFSVNCFFSDVIIIKPAIVYGSILYLRVRNTAAVTILLNVYN